MLSFKQFLNESPLINKSHTKEFLGHYSDLISNELKKNHENSTLLGNSDVGTYHKQEQQPNTIYYYHHVNDSPREFSIISDNEQKIVTKGNGGDSKYLHWIMKKHVDDHGKLSSSNSNTYGSQKLWSDLVDSDPKYSLHHLNIKTNIETPMTKEYLDKNKKEIWSVYNDAKDHKVILKKNV